mgnify:FL=1
MDEVVRMGKSEDTFIPIPVNDRNLAIEDLAFLSDGKNDKAITYAIECINKLAKIEQIVNEWNNDASHSFSDMCKINVILKQ